MLCISALVDPVLHHRRLLAAGLVEGHRPGGDGRPGVSAEGEAGVRSRDVAARDPVQPAGGLLQQTDGEGCVRRPRLLVYGQTLEGVACPPLNVGIYVYPTPTSSLFCCCAGVPAGCLRQLLPRSPTLLNFAVSTDESH